MRTGFGGDRSGSPRHMVTESPSTEQQAAAKARREQELAASAFQELDDDMDGL